MKPRKIAGMKPEHRARCAEGLAQSGMGRVQAEKFLDAGFWPVKKLRAATDEELLAIPGIGTGTVKKLHAWMKPKARRGA